MNSIPHTGSLQSFLAATAVSLGSMVVLTATPQMPPEGEAEIAGFIQTDLNSDSKLADGKFSISLEGAIATLTGTAASLAQSERVHARAIASEGVHAVVNQIEVAPQPDARIIEGAKAALREQKIFSAGGVAVGVSDGRARLTGQVGVWDDAEIARQIVSAVPGVTFVENKLDVTYEGVRGDREIEAQLKFMIQNDPLYHGLDLPVTVGNGVVRLGGAVGSRGEYDRLIRRCYVTGVVDVQISGLSINRELAMEGLEDKDYTQDQSLAALRAVLEKDSRIDAAKIRADMKDGMVALAGSVGSISERDAVEYAARLVPGVLGVSNKLEIAADQLAAKREDFRAASPPLVKPPR